MYRGSQARALSKGKRGKRIKGTHVKSGTHARSPQRKAASVERRCAYSKKAKTSLKKNSHHIIILQDVGGHRESGSRV